MIWYMWMPTSTTVPMRTIQSSFPKPREFKAPKLELVDVVERVRSFELVSQARRWYR